MFIDIYTIFQQVFYLVFLVICSTDIAMRVERSTGEVVHMVHIMTCREDSMFDYLHEYKFVVPREFNPIRIAATYANEILNMGSDDNSVSWSEWCAIKDMANLLNDLQ